MNQKRRTLLSKLNETLQEVSFLLSQYKDEEQDTFDSLPEGLQNSERGQSIQANSDLLDTAQTAVDDAIMSINEAIGV